MTTGREAPMLEEYIFPATGVTVRIRKVSPLLSQEVLRNWRKKHPEPEPPYDEIKYGHTTKLEPNYSNPSYLRARQLWTERMNEEVGSLTLRMIIERGVEVDLPAEEIQQFRDEMLRDYEIEVEGSDKYVYVAYMCVGTDKDLEELRDAIIARSQPTEEAIDEKVKQFRR